ncbi:glycosyltransferase family 4 protein [Winogradskyella sp. UBA3174]|uniref:glycosyltransferase family 4 protein n=1 Tax=Winogradskyella sp. UBA3174 TaxID=1947785 RepID=UPI0025E12BCA|nr:glycosyltransferase family 4 protein [Winogradskyella sp. UBA3174]|tara:strand:- start:43183 stop:44325 length:1143 start_codon:yes stop_codon:yes gene_type:complete
MKEIKDKRILIVASLSASLINFRGDFIASLVKNGFTVYAAAPDHPERIRVKLEALGAIPLEFSLNRTGLNPIKDLNSISELKTLIKEYKIDLVFPYTVKPVIYSSIAANKCKVPVISLITGLGFAFTGLTFKARVLQRLNETLYKLSIRKNKIIIFQNNDDYQLFLDRKIISKDNKVALVSGSGVNLNQYKTRVKKNTSDTISFLMVARLIKEKGIALYLEAAKTLKEKYPKAEFHVIGAPDKSPSAIKLEELNALHENGTIIYHGNQRNVPEHLYNRDVFVLPTYYREGIPRSILEALSVGLPIITTNTPGCKETILKDKNGILIKPMNLNELTNAMEYFLINKEKIEEMGINSRAYAENRFDVNIINNDLINLINETI